MFLWDLEKDHCQGNFKYFVNFFRQPVITSLKAFGDPNDVSLLQNLVEARHATLGDRPFESLNKLEENSELIYGSLIQLWIKTIDSKGFSEDDIAKNIIEKISRAVGIVTLLRYFKNIFKDYFRATLPLLKEGLVLLPVDSMKVHGLNGDLIFNNKKPEELRNLTRDLCQVNLF